MEDDDSAWGNAASDDFSVSVYHHANGNGNSTVNGQRPNFQLAIPVPVVARVNVTVHRPPPTSLGKGRKLVHLHSKAAKAFPSTSFDTAFSITEEEEDSFQSKFPDLPETNSNRNSNSIQPRKQPISGKKSVHAKSISHSQSSLHNTSNHDSVSAADRFHSSFGNIQELDWSEQPFGQGNGCDNDTLLTVNRSTTRETRKERSATKEPRGRSVGRITQDKKERRRGRSSGPLLHNNKNSNNNSSRNRSTGRSSNSEESRSRSKSRERETLSKKGSITSAHRDRSRSRGPLDGSQRPHSGTYSRSRSNGPPDATPSSDGRRRVRARSKDAATTASKDSRGKSPGALRRAGSPRKLREASSRIRVQVRSRSPTRMQEGHSKSPGALARRTTDAACANPSASATSRKERTTFAPPRRAKSLDFEFKVDCEETNSNNNKDVELATNDNYFQVPRRASRKNIVDDSTKRASQKNLEDYKSTRSNRSNLEKSLRELPGDSQRTRRDDKSISARSSGGKTATTNSSGSSNTGTLSLSLEGAVKMSRRSSRKDHGLHSSNNSASSGDSSERDAMDGTKERRRQERVRSARERLLEEEAKVIRLQEAARLLEEKRILEEARLEALREEARRLEQSLGQGENELQKKKPIPHVAKKYGAGVGDMSQVPPAFQTWSKKNHK